MEKIMWLIDNELIKKYSKDDSTIKYLDQFSLSEDEKLICQRWLRQSLPKRYIYHTFYGALFLPGNKLKVLDVGGGLTALTIELARRHDYYLVDLLAHDSHEMADIINARVGRNFIYIQDWEALDCMPFDLVIANDIFPNVDQRLELFLQRYLPYSKQIKLSLTYYNNPRFYMTRRINAEEILCMLAWNHEQLNLVLKKYESQIIKSDFDLFLKQNESVYSNGRQICIVEFKGDKYEKETMVT